MLGGAPRVDLAGPAPPLDGAVSEEPSPPPAWWLYVLVSDDGRRTYVGITLDVSRRLAQHNGERPGGARATRAGRPWSVGRVFGPYAERGEVSRAEHTLKALRGLKRLDWAGRVVVTPPDDQRPS